MRRSRPFVPFALSLPLLALACRPAMRHSSYAMPTAERAPIVVPTVRVSDAQVAAIVLLGNNVDLAYANLALVRTTHPDVQQYARRMIADHGGLNAMLEEVIERINLKARDDSVSFDMRKASGTRRGELRAVRAEAAFDVAYARLEIRHHREMLDLIDRLLLSSASKDELRQYVEWLRPAERAHLAHAEQLLSTLPTGE